MDPYRWTAALLALATCHCTSGPTSTPARDPEPTSPSLPAPPSPPPNENNGEAPAPSEPACTISSGLRLRIDAGQTLPTGTGLTITYEGASHDNFGPDGFDMPISLHFRRENEEARRLPSFRDHRPDEVLGHCYRMLDADTGAVVLEVSTLPGKQKSPPTAPPTLEGAGGTPPPGASSCTVTDDNGPLPGGKQVTHGCAPNEVCVCEARAGYSCSGRCALIQQH